MFPDGLVSCFWANGPNLVFYDPGNVWWSFGAPTIGHHGNNDAAGNTIYATLQVTTYIMEAFL